SPFSNSLHRVTWLRSAAGVAMQHVRCASAKRNAVRLRSAVLACCACLPVACATSSGGPPPDAGLVEVWTTTADRQQALSPSTLAMTASGDGEVEIEVDARTRYQRMLGFGASITDSSAWLIRHRMDEAQREALLRELFGRDGD